MLLTPNTVCVPCNRCTIHRIFLKIYLNGLTIVKRNRSAKPLSIHTVLPTDVNALKNGCGCTPKHIEVEYLGKMLRLHQLQVSHTHQLQQAYLQYLHKI